MSGTKRLFSGAFFIGQNVRFLSIFTEDQFANIIRSHGYKFERVDDSYVLFRGGVKAATLPLSEIERHISEEYDTRK